MRDAFLEIKSIPFIEFVHPQISSLCASSTKFLLVDEKNKNKVVLQRGGAQRVYSFI